MKLVFSKVISCENKLKLIHKLMHKLSLEFIATDYYRGFMLITVKGFHVTLQWQHKLFCELQLKSDTVAQVFKFSQVEFVNPV